MEAAAAFTHLANRGRVMPEGTAGLVILGIAVAALVAMILYGGVSRRCRRRG